MNIAIISLVFLVALLTFSFIGRLFRKKNESFPIPSSPIEKAVKDIATSQESNDPTEEDDDECCGEHEVCEKGKIKRALRTDIEYFDDEELDVYRGTPSDEYDDDSVEEFREVLYTMDPREIDDWLKSLELREIALPDALKDELFMLMETKGQ